MTESVQTTISMHRDDLEKIVSILNKFPEVNFFDIRHESSGGIGSSIEIEFSHKIQDVNGTFKSLISNYDEW